MSQVQPGDLVKIHYTGRLANGAVFGTSEGSEPIEFTAGSPQMLEGLSQGVLGMQVGEKKSITLTPEEGFGQREPALQQQVARAMLPEGVKVGDQLIAQSGGQQQPVWVRELGEEYAVLDGNHPLAGQTLVFDIELVSVQPT